jgi:hypothetical protein
VEEILEVSFERTLAIQHVLNSGCGVKVYNSIAYKSILLLYFSSHCDYFNLSERCLSYMGITLGGVIRITRTRE